MNRAACSIIVLALAASVSACRREAPTGPPELRVGRDQCLECGMLISEDRCAAVILMERGGAREHAVFDDVGCLLDWLGETHDPPARALETFLREYDARTWIPAHSAVVLRADPDRLHTPMGSGIVAFANAAAADARQREFGGTVTDYAALVADGATPSGEAKP